MSNSDAEKIYEQQCKELLELLGPILRGRRNDAVFSVGLNILCTAAKSLNFSKLDVQKLLVDAWDGKFNKQPEEADHESAAH